YNQGTVTIAIPSSFKTKTFDVVCVSEVLEHTLDVEETLKETRRILKDDGIAIVTVPWLYELFHRPSQHILTFILETKSLRYLFKKIVFPDLEKIEKTRIQDIFQLRVSCLVPKKDFIDKRLCKVIFGVSHCIRLKKTEDVDGLKKLYSLKYRYGHLFHTHFYKPKKWKNILIRCGFDVEEKGFGYVWPIPTRTMNVVRRDEFLDRFFFKLAKRINTIKPIELLNSLYFCFICKKSVHK
ncbi:class I SAM-dependent methyltransferase, partial [Candidatus Altiarchaeota archaeon]